MDENSRQSARDAGSWSPGELLRRAQELERAGRLEQAESVYRQMLGPDPAHADALHLLGLLCFRTGRQMEGLDLLRQSIRVRPANPGAHSDLATMLGIMGRLEEALCSLRRTIELAPGHAPAHNNLGVTLEKMGRFDEAAAAFARAAELDSRQPGFRNHQGNALRKAGKPAAAEAAFRRALALDGSFPPALQNLAGLLQENVGHDEAVMLFRRAIDVQPQDAALHSSLLYSIHYHPGLSQQEIFDEHRRWAQRHEAPLRKHVLPHTHDRSPDRRLRIGYVSPDFRGHSVTTFFEPLLTHHDHERFEIACYSSAKRADTITQRLRSKADRWRDIAKLSDDDAATLIRADQIDIFVDLTGHMADNRLLVFARKPAPIQVTYVGHPDTTGMAAMNFRITDPYLDPPDGESDRYHTEKLVRLPRIFGCYQVPEEPIAVVPPPCERNGFITFGCLNNSAKITAPALILWAELLDSIPGSRLILLGDQLPSRVKEIFAGRGVDLRRVARVGKLSRLDYLKTYNQIDLALDCFPYNGQTTSCDGFWMGVPVVALAGTSYVSRMGGCLLKQVGLDEFVAATPERYKEICQVLATDPGRLSRIRSGLRQALLASPVVDGAALARDIETAYRQMWVTLR